MRLIDAEALKKAISEHCRSEKECLNHFWYDENIIALIDNAPTVDITEEQAIDKLHETGWLPMHDKEMTERPQGEWIVEDWTKIIECNLCHGQAPICVTSGEQYESNFCPICGADMRGGAES